MTEIWLAIVLLINGADHAQVAPGEPVVLTVRVQALEDLLGSEVLAELQAHPPGAYRLVGPGPADAWTAGIRFFLYSERDERWEPLPWPVHLVASGDGEPQPVVGPSAHAEADFGIDPEQTIRLAPGGYRLRAEIGARHEAEPNLLELVSQEARMEVTRDQVRHDDPEALERLVGYLNGRSRFAEAEPHARRLAELRPDEPGPRILLGDTLAGLERPREAMASYLLALSWFTERGAESPRALIDRINSLQERYPGVMHPFIRPEG